MTVIMTPDKEPFFGGTYFPPRQGRPRLAGRPGSTSSHEMRDALSERLAPGEVVARSQEISQRVEQLGLRPAGARCSRVTRSIAVAVSQLATNGSIGSTGVSRERPSFLSPRDLLLLLRYARRTAGRRRQPPW